MNSSEPDSSPKLQQSQEFERHPVEVVISSDEATPVYRSSPRQTPFEREQQEVTLINPHEKGEDEAEKREQEKLRKMAEEMEELQEKQQQELEANRALLIRNKQKETERQAEKKLRKEFESYFFLPTSSLLSVKSKLSQFDNRCKMQTLPPQQKQFLKLRQENRQRLTRVLLLAIEELRHKLMEEKTEAESTLLDEQTDSLKRVYDLSKELETIFWRRLKKMAVKSGGEQYQKQIKLILREFNDKNNLEFRRGILNRRLNLRELCQATEEQLRCEKTKEEDKARMEQLIRESEKDPIAAANEMQPQAEPEQELPQAVSSLNSFPSVTQMAGLQEPRENQEQARKQQNKELSKKTKHIYKKCKASILAYTEQRQDRTRRLMENHLRNPFFAALCDKVGI